MAFVKRKVGIQRHVQDRQGSAVTRSSSAAEATQNNRQSFPGTRPSPLTGRATTSTGVASLDSYLGGHAGLITGAHLLIEESGTTDFAGAVLKFFAAEGVVQGHCLHIIGPMDESWIQQLPGLSTSGLETQSMKERKVDDDKMKIAWRYQQLGLHRGTGTSTAIQENDQVFCHNFDMAKRLVIPQKSSIQYVLPKHDPSISPFADVTAVVSKSIVSSPTNMLHRIVIPGLLSPAFYPPHASNPRYLLQFLHSLRALLRQHSDRLVAVTSIPTELYSRDTGLVRWMEHLSDGVLELQPFAQLTECSTNSLAESGGSRGTDEQPQGMLKFHKLPDLTERGVRGLMGGGVDDDLAFTLSRRRFTIRPFSLPPLEDDQEARSTRTEKGALQGAKKSDVEF